MIQPERIEPLNNATTKDRDYILYWMQAAQRVENNHALEYAIRMANERAKPLLTAFVLTDDYPQANRRHYAFMIAGLRQVERAMAKRRIPFVVVKDEPAAALIRLARRADAVVVDEGYLRVQRLWRSAVADGINCPLVEVTTNLIVPVRTASDKENFSAGTLRPRITRQLERFLVPPASTSLKNHKLDLKITCRVDLSDQKLIDTLKLDASVSETPFYTGGAAEARKRLAAFIDKKLARYDTDRNDPLRDCQSNLSPYLHFGQISPLAVALAVMETKNSAGKAAFLEELIVRRELSHNFVYYNRDYDVFDKALPPWALRTLNYSAKDKRPYLYTLEELETADTRDAAWNAAQREMMLTGKMHNYMRMYWGKKILEWTKTPQQGFDWALYLNNKYELDGRDPNGFAGVAWCFGKHDRAWAHRPVFGKVRYMNAAGLKRKFDVAAYIQKIDALK